MIKKQFTLFLSAVIVLCFFAAPVFAAKLQSVRYSSSDEKIRIVFDIDSPFTYKKTVGNGVVIIDLEGVTAEKNIKDIVLDDEIGKKITFIKDGGKTTAKIFLKKGLKVDDFDLDDPDRLVVDLLKGQEVVVKVPVKAPAKAEKKPVKKAEKKEPKAVKPVKKIVPKTAEVKVAKVPKVEKRVEKTEKPEKVILVKPEKAEVTKAEIEVGLPALTKEAVTAAATPEEKAEIKEFKKTIISSVMVSSSFDNLKVVFTPESFLGYNVSSTESQVVLRLPAAYLAEPTDEVAVEDKIMSRIEFRRDYGDLTVIFPYTYKTPFRVYTLAEPYRIVVEFIRIFEEKTVDTVADGIKHITLRRGTKNGPVVINAIVAEQEKVELFPALAKGNGKQVMEFLDEDGNVIKEEIEVDVVRNFFKNPVSQIVKDNGALAGINATYFSPTGRPLGSLMIDRNWISFPINSRSALVITRDGGYQIENVDVDARLVLEDNTEVGIDGLNRSRGEEEVILYNTVFGKSTSTNNSGVDIVIREGKVDKKTLSNADIPGDGFVVSAHGAAGRGLYEVVEVGDLADIEIEVMPPLGKLKHVIGGGPRLIKDGKVMLTADEEKFKGDIKVGRAARTAVGITRDEKVILATVDGLVRVKEKAGEKRVLGSIGMTLQELAQMMLDLGAENALNFDGGSPTDMVIGDKVVNTPVNLKEAPVGDALLLKKK